MKEAKLSRQIISAWLKDSIDHRAELRKWLGFRSDSITNALFNSGLEDLRKQIISEFHLK